MYSKVGAAITSGKHTNNSAVTFCIGWVLKATVTYAIPIRKKLRSLTQVIFLVFPVSYI